METTFICLRRLSQLTGLPDAWLRAEANAGRIPSVRIGRKLLFHFPAVERALLETVSGSAEPSANAT